MHDAMVRLVEEVTAKDDADGEEEEEKDRKKEKHWSPSDLLVKLRTFERDQPRLHKLLLRRLRELHDFHSAN
jgi:hypothetical protein